MIKLNKLGVRVRGAYNSFVSHTSCKIFVEEHPTYFIAKSPETGKLRYLSKLSYYRVKNQLWYIGDDPFIRDSLEELQEAGAA